MIAKFIMMNTNKTIAELEAEYLKDFSLKSWNALNNARFLEQKKNKVVEKKRKNKKQWDKK
jgi:hypothetical protein